MAKLNQMELNQLREIIACHQNSAAKLKEYAGKCNDPQIKQMFEQGSTDADKGAQNLLQML